MAPECNRRAPSKSPVHFPGRPCKRDHPPTPPCSDALPEHPTVSPPPPARNGKRHPKSDGPEATPHWNCNDW
eukprot:1087373-Alexandrium_andersonii.AAC.1